MSETKPPRLPACARGTDHRVEADGHYWVRLVTRRAMQAEGECLQNCLRHGHRLDHAGPDDLKDAALWSLRRAEDAVSIALAQVDEDGRLEEFKGPYNNQVSGTGYRQLQALRDYLVMYGAMLTFDEDDVLVGEDGTTYRADKAPKELRDAIEAKRAAERAEWESRNAERLAEEARRLQDMRAAMMTEMVEGGIRHRRPQEAWNRTFAARRARRCSGFRRFLNRINDLTHSHIARACQR